MSAKHTPGPWAVCHADDADEMVELDCLGVYSAADLAQKDECSSAICFMNDNWGEFEANARLIAAAPELLEAVKEARDRLFGAGMLGGADDPINVAVAKAEAKP